MLRIVIALLLAVLFVTPGLNRKEVSGAPVPPSIMTVIVSFSGLIVFNPILAGGYEAGVLIEGIAPGHHLEVRDVKGDKVKLDTLTKGETWSLSITNSSTGVTATRIKPDLKDRKKDDWEGQYDSRWLIDLYNDLHPDLPLEVEPGRLNPIIRLKDGVLYSRYKTDFMQRVKGVAKGKAKAKAKQKRAGEEYGFFAENAALKLEVPQGEKLVLEKEGPGTKRTIYEWPYVYRPEPFEIWIKNIRDPKRPHSDKSDFRLYYKIFKKEVPEALQYDFYIK
jgi:hypothetical protein